MSNDDLNDYHTNSLIDDLSEFHSAIVYCINREQNPHGLAIQTRLEEAGYEVHHGRLYPALDELCDRGLVSRRSGGRTNHYSLTSDGRDWLTSNRDRVEQFPADESNRRPDGGPS